MNGEQIVSILCFLEKSVERDTGQRGDGDCDLKVCCFVFSFFNSRWRFFILKHFKRLRHQSALIALSQANKTVLTYFSVLRYIADFKGAELQFPRILIGVRTKLLVDPTKMKL